MALESEVRGRATVSIVDAARRLGIGRNQAYAAAARGEIPVIKIGKEAAGAEGRARSHARGRADRGRVMMNVHRSA